jgi:hypothetical protein
VKNEKKEEKNEKNENMTMKANFNLSFVSKHFNAQVCLNP